jgi:hypothetical protein
VANDNSIAIFSRDPIKIALSKSQSAHKSIDLRLGTQVPMPAVST